MTASTLKQDPNTKRFKQTLIYFNTDTLTQYAHFQGNPTYIWFQIDFNAHCVILLVQL